MFYLKTGRPYYFLDVPRICLGLLFFHLIVVVTGICSGVRSGDPAPRHSTLHALPLLLQSYRGGAPGLVLAVEQCVRAAIASLTTFLARRARHAPRPTHTERHRGPVGAPARLERLVAQASQQDCAVSVLPD